MDEKSLKPQLRFKGFADAWEQRKLDDFCKISIGEFVIKTKQRDDAPYPVYNGGTSYTGFYDDFNQTGKKVIISARGANAGYVNKSEKPYWAGNSCYSIDVKDETNWIFLYHKIKHIQTSFIKGQQSANIPSVSKEQVQKTEIMCPQVTEQNKIAIFLEDMDNLITLHQRKLDKLSNVKKALLEKMFPKNDSDVPEIRFKGFTDAWEQRKLSKIATMHARIGWQNLRKSEFLDSGDYYLITGTDFDDGKIDLKNCHYVAKERYDQDRNIQVKNGSILITKDGTLGKVAYVSNLKKPATLNAGVFNVELLTENTDRKYLFQYLKAPFLMAYVAQKATGGTIKHLNQNILVDFPVIGPTKPEQQKIGAFFSNLDNLITLHQRKLEKLKNIKKACLEKMFV